MTLQATAPTLASSDSLAALEIASAPLKALATKTAAQYQALVETRKAMELQAQGKPVDEEQFFLGAVSKLSRAHDKVERSIQELETQFASDPKVEQVAQNLRNVLNGRTAQVKPVHTTSLAPVAKPDAIAKAQNAISALANFINSGSDDAQEKERLANVMFNAFKQVKQNDDPAFRKSKTFQSLLKAHDSLLQAAIAPKVPVTVQEGFTNALQIFADAAQEISANRDLVQKYIDTQQQENNLRKQIPLLKQAIAEQWNADTSRTNQEGFLVPNNLFFQHPLFGQINTNLSVALEAFEAPINRALALQYEALLPHIDTHYAAQRIEGDGNCLFHSVAYLTNTDYQSARQKITTHMKQNPTLFKALIEERIGNDPDVEAGMMRFRGTIVERYVAYMEQNGIWGGKPELQALSNIEARPIIARQKGAATISFFPTKGKLKTRAPLLILNSGGHFEPLVARR